MKQVVFCCQICRDFIGAQRTVRNENIRQKVTQYDLFFEVEKKLISTYQASVVHPLK